MATPKRQAVGVSPQAVKAVRTISQWSGLPQQKIIERLLTWFSTLDQDTQGVVLGSLPQSRRPEFARQVLHWIAMEGGARYNSTPETGAQEPGTAPPAPQAGTMSSAPTGRKSKK